MKSQDLFFVTACVIVGAFIVFFAAFFAVGYIKRRCIDRRTSARSFAFKKNERDLNELRHHFGHRRAHKLGRCIVERVRAHCFTWRQFGLESEAELWKIVEESCVRHDEWNRMRKIDEICVD
jgi:hypothetical protein